MKKNVTTMIAGIVLGYALCKCINRKKCKLEKTKRLSPCYEMFAIDSTPKTEQESKTFNEEYYVSWTRDDDHHNWYLKLHADGIFELGLPNSEFAYSYRYINSGNISSGRLNEFEIIDLTESEIDERHSGNDEIGRSEYIFVNDLNGAIHTCFVYLQDRDLVQVMMDDRVLDFELYLGDTISENDNPYR